MGKSDNNINDFKGEKMMLVNKKSLVIILAIVAIIFSILVYVKIQNGAKQHLKKELSDYPKSTWYSKETDYFITLEDSDDNGLLRAEYEGWLDCYRIKYEDDTYKVTYYDEEKKTRYGGVLFSMDIEKKEEKTIMTLYDFSDVDNSDEKGKIQTKEMFGKYEQIVFEKVPNQDIWEHTDSLWKSKETGYMVEVIKTEDGNDAYCTVEYLGKKEEYRIEDMGISYEEDTDGTYNTGVFFDSRIYGTNKKDMTMVWYNFHDVNAASKTSKERTKVLFKKHDKITFERVK